MANQIAISAKIDSWIIDKLDREIAASGKKRNRIINDALSLYFKYQDARRCDRACHHEGNQPDRHVIDFMSGMLHERAKIYLDLIDYH